MQSGGCSEKKKASSFFQAAIPADRCAQITTRCSFQNPWRKEFTLNIPLVNSSRIGIFSRMIYRRHLKTCSHRRQGRRYWACQCPIWADFRRDGVRIHKSMNVTDFEKARALEDLWIRGGEEIFDSGIPREEKVETRPITIAEAWQKFWGQASYFPSQNG
jgi:hypothetical protein